MVDAYAIAFAGFLMLGGRAADHFGQRRTFVAAMLLFGAASLLGGLAQDRIMLISARGAQGFAGALMAASSLAIITANFQPGPQLHRAIGTWAAMNGAGGAAGVLFGGVITQELSWRWVLLINPPIAIAAALIAHKVVRERRRAPDARFDLAGALTLTIGQVVLVYRRRRSGAGGLELGESARADPRRHRAARAVRSDRESLREGAADPVQGADAGAADRQHDRAAFQRLDLPDVDRELPVPAAGARALAARHRPDLPADDARDHGRRLARRAAGEPVRRAHGARHGPA